MLIPALVQKHEGLKILFSKTSIKYLQKQTNELRGRIINRLDYAIDNPKNIIRLKGNKPFKYKIVVGDVRIILTKDSGTIRILEIGNRGQIYNNLT